MPSIIFWACALAAKVILRLAVGRVSTRQALEIGMDYTLGGREIYADAYDWAHYESQSMYVIANGIGRSRKGEIAAKAAADTFVRLFEATGATDNPSYFFQTAFHAANAAILQRIVDSTAGASVLCAVIDAGKLYYALAGNCKICVYRHGDLIPLSEGQTLEAYAKQVFRQGRITRKDALAALNDKRLYNFVGHDGFKDLELFDIPVSLKKGDIVVLMTDGVYDFCTPNQLEGILKSNRSSQNMASAVIEKLEQENNPEQDNATVVLVKINQL